MAYAQRWWRAAVLTCTVAAAAGTSSTKAAEPAVEELKARYAELQEFKYDAEFRAVGYGQCCKYAQWKSQVEALGNEASPLVFIEGFGILPGELVDLGRAYFRNDMQRVAFLEREIKAAMTGTGPKATITREEHDGVIGRWRAKDRPIRGGVTEYTLERKAGVLVLHAEYPDGSKGTEEMEEIEAEGRQARKFRSKDSGFNEWFVIHKDGSMGYYDTHGVIFRGEKR